MYLDTSILVKLFVREPGSDFYGELVDGQPVSTSYIASTEFWSALLMKERTGELSSSLRRNAWSSFERKVEDNSIELIPMSPALFKRANRIMEACHPKVPLRSLDALHLASADQIQDWPLVTSDQRMRIAAELLKYPVAPLP